MSLLVTDLDLLLDRARALLDSGPRRLLGIAGAPGAGKSTLAAAVTAELAPHAVLVPMDGFHLAQAELDRLGRAGRKGAPDTFDVAGFVALLGRLRVSADAASGTVYAPAFRRDIEEPIAGAIPIWPQARLVVVEGNYLLLEDPDWAPVRGLLDETWLLQTPEEVRLARLVARHRDFGKSADEALAWATGSDAANAALVAASAGNADVLVRLEGD